MIVTTRYVILADPSAGTIDHVSMDSNFPSEFRRKFLVFAAGAQGSEGALTMTVATSQEGEQNFLQVQSILDQMNLEITLDQSLSLRQVVIPKHIANAAIGTPNKGYAILEAIDDNLHLTFVEFGGVREFVIPEAGPKKESAQFLSIMESEALSLGILSEKEKVNDLQDIPRIAEAHLAKVRNGEHEFWFQLSGRAEFTSRDILTKYRAYIRGVISKIGTLIPQKNELEFVFLIGEYLGGAVFQEEVRDSGFIWRQKVFLLGQGNSDLEYLKQLCNSLKVSQANPFEDDNSQQNHEASNWEEVDGDIHFDSAEPNEVEETQKDMSNDDLRGEPIAEGVISDLFLRNGIYHVEFDLHGTGSDLMQNELLSVFKNEFDKLSIPNSCTVKPPGLKFSPDSYELTIQGEWISLESYLSSKIKNPNHARAFSSNLLKRLIPAAKEVRNVCGVHFHTLSPSAILINPKTSPYKKPEILIWNLGMCIEDCLERNRLFGAITKSHSRLSNFWNPGHKTEANGFKNDLYAMIKIFQHVRKDIGFNGIGNKKEAAVNKGLDLGYDDWNAFEKDFGIKPRWSIWGTGK